MKTEIWSERTVAYANVIESRPDLVAKAAASDLHLTYLVLTPSDKFVSAGSIGVNRTGISARNNVHNEQMLAKLVAESQGRGSHNGVTAAARMSVASEILSLVDAEERRIVERLSA